MPQPTSKARLVITALFVDHQSPAEVAALWASTGLGMTWSDCVVNREDVLFHLALSIFMPVLAGIGHGVVWLTLRRNSLAV